MTGGPQNLVPPYYVNTPAILAGFLRDAVADKEVYGIALLEFTDVLLEECTYSEQLLYDFDLELVGDSLNRLRAANFVLLCVKKPRRIYGYDCVFCLDQNKICSLSLNQENPNKL